MGLFSIFTKEIAIDLGTANTVILWLMNHPLLP